MRKMIVAMFCGLFVFSAFAQPRGTPVKPRQFFPSDVLNAYSPDSEGWAAIAAGQNGLVFGKQGGERSETYAAHVILFKLDETKNSQEFVSVIKERIAKVNPPTRFKENHSTFNYHERRGYPCVDVQSVYDDTAAVTPDGTQSLKLQVVALYCRHPLHPQLGFFAAYSHRGKSLDIQMEGPARKFIDGVTVPQKKNN